MQQKVVLSFNMNTFIPIARKYFIFTIPLLCCLRWHIQWLYYSISPLTSNCIQNLGQQEDYSKCGSHNFKLQLFDSLYFLEFIVFNYYFCYYFFTVLKFPLKKCKMIFPKFILLCILEITYSIILLTHQYVNECFSSSDWSNGTGYISRLFCFAKPSEDISPSDFNRFIKVIWECFCLTPNS